jgi:uncharacterized protein involved in response to NO
MKSISPLMLIVCILINLAGSRLAGFFLPDKLYFSFSSFLFDTRDLDKPTAILAKLAVPFLISMALTGALFLLRRFQSGVQKGETWANRTLEDQAVVTLTFGAAFTAVLMAWPYILLWDMLIDPKLAPQRLTFLVAYAAYFTATGFFAMAGADPCRCPCAARSANWS